MSNPFLRAYEFEKKYGLDRLRLTLEKAEQAYKTHEPETIDLCKSALECICKSILKERLGDSYKDTLPKIQILVGQTLDILGLKSDDVKGNIKGLSGAFGQIRNDESLAGHGLEGAKPLIGKREINLYVSTFSHITEMVLHLLSEENVDIAKTRMSFEALEEHEKLEEINAVIDLSVDVRYSKDEGVLFVEGKEIKPSELLYHFDRPNYQQRVEQVKELEKESRLEQFKELISDELYERFDGFYPSHYGLDAVDICFDSVQQSGRIFKINGNVSTSARIGASRAEDSIDIPYSSEFKAEIENIAEIGDGDMYELLNLDLSVADWIAYEPDEDAA